MDVTWKCYVCGRERPDRHISVLKSTWRKVGSKIDVSQVVRYCNDDPQCAGKAVTVSFLPDSYERVD